MAPKPKPSAAGDNLKRLTDLYRTMVRIRAFEETAIAAHKAGEIPGPLHVSIGQEGVAAGICVNLYEGSRCTDDSACEIPGQRCIDFKDGQFCGYPNLGHSLSAQKTQSCLTGADCDPDRTCFANRCVNVEDVATAKIRNIVTAARMLREKYG